MLRFLFSFFKTSRGARKFRSAMVIIALICLVIITVGMLLGNPDWPVSKRLPQVAHWASVAVVISFLVTFFVAFIIAGLHRRIRDLEAQEIHDDLMDDGHTETKFVLYLRPFDSTDEVKLKVEETNKLGKEVKREYELESQLLDAIKPIAKFIGLGRSMENDGIGRIEVDDETWQESADALMKAANLIVMLPATNPGTLWEVEKLFSDDLLSKTVLLNEYQDGWSVFQMFDDFDQSDDWAALRQLFDQHGYNLPTFQRKGQMIFFGDSKPKPKYRSKLNLSDVKSLRKFIRRAYRYCN